MRFSPIFIFVSFITIVFSGFVACNSNDRQVVPCDTDIEKVLKPLQPNEEDSPLGLSFGSDNIPGVTFDYEMETNDSNVYVFLPDFTLLDLDASISQKIFTFISQMMKENDFLKESFDLPANIFAEKLSQGLTYAEVATELLDTIKNDFYEQMELIEPITSPFNMYFQIYPVYLDQDYVTYRQGAYIYTGGAHGITFSYLVTYNLQDGKRLLLDDIVKPEGLEDVREEVAAHMAYSYPIYENITTVGQYIDSLNSWLDNFEPSKDETKVTYKNFPLSDPALVSEGLAFIYQMYELTPGSDGCPLVVIPYKDLKGCLKISL